MNNDENKSDETRTIDTERNIDIERERLELDRQRLNLDVESHETSKNLDSERIVLEKSKERTAKLQIGLPVLVTILALAFSAFNEYRRSAEAQNLQRMQYELQYNQAVSSYNEGRLELFKRMTEHTTDVGEVKKTYAEIFPNDSIILDDEQRKAREKLATH